MKLLQGLALAATATTIGAMATGSNVTASGEGLSCPPGILCPFGIEMLHRLFVGALGLLVLALVVFAHRLRKEDRTAFRVSLLVLGLLVAQALLGQVTIAVRLHPAVVSAHQALAATLLAVLALLTARVFGFGGRAPGRT